MQKNLEVFSLTCKKVTFTNEIMTGKFKLHIFFTHLAHEKRPKPNFSSQDYSVENNYFFEKRQMVFGR